MNARHGFDTHGYRARSARDVARILDRYRVTGPARVAALRGFHRNGFTIVPIPAGRLVVNRSGN